MAEDPDKKPSGEKGVVDELLTELGVDNEMRQELIDSGRMSSDVMRVESADQVRRRMEIDKSVEKLQESIGLLERNIMTVDGSIDRIERDLVPVVLSFLVGLKGNLVSMRGDIVSRSKRSAKTNLQVTFIDNDVKPIVAEEFLKVEDSLTSGMSTPILEKVRDLTESLKEAMKFTVEQLSTLKSNIDDYTQRSSTEVEFLSSELGMKPRVEIPKEIAEKMKLLERRIEELSQELSISQQKVETRESEIETLRKDNASLKVINEEIEEELAGLKAKPQTDVEVLSELRANAKTLEATRDLLQEKITEVEERAANAEQRGKEYAGDIAKKDLELGDLKTKIRQLEDEKAKAADRLTEMEEIRARLRSYESGDKARELERLKTEFDRTSANLERAASDLAETKDKLEHTQETLEGYLDLMDSTEKTKAFLMVEEHGEMSTREIASSLGVAPAIVMKWADEFQALGIAWIVDGQTLVHRDFKKE
jgi:predicted  nucleic acid-binding Zn-ribbon protein